MMFYITTHEANKLMAKKVKKYFDEQNVPYAFVYGIECEAPIEPFIQVDCKEAYENLPLKTFLLIEHFLLHTNHEYMVKLDDDTFLDVKKLKMLRLTEDYIGVFEKPAETLKNTIYHWYKIQNAEYKVQKKVISNLSYAQGACYILSRKAARKIFNKGKEYYINTPTTYLGEDVKVGLVLSEPDIIKKDIKETNYDLFYEIGQNFLFIHPIHFLLYEQMLNTTNEEKKKLLRKKPILNTNYLREVYLNNILNSNEHIINDNGLQNEFRENR